MAAILTGLLIVFGIADQTLAQSNVKLKGSIYDAVDGTPVSGATAELTGTGDRVFSDRFGVYQFENIPPGEYTLLVTAPGYTDLIKNHVEIAPDIAARVDIRLEPRLYRLEKITVRDRRHRIRTAPVTVLMRDEINRRDPGSLSDLLETVEGVYVQKTGTGGHAQVRIRGSHPGHVLVLIDGQKLNPSGSGVADLNSIPIDMVEQVEIYRGGASAEFGPDALAGAINIITRPHRLIDHLAVEAKKGWGSWKNEIYHLTLIDPVDLKDFSAKLAVKIRQAVGNFDYAYTPSGTNSYDTTHTGTRTNNSYDAYNYFASGRYRINNRLALSFSGQSFRARSGLPDRATRPNEAAFSLDRRWMLTAVLDLQPSTGHIYNLDLGASRLSQHFKDPDTLTPPFFDGKFTNDIFTARHQQQHDLWQGGWFKGGLEFRRDILRHIDFAQPSMSMGHSSRNNFGLSLAAGQNIEHRHNPVINRLAVDLALRSDYARTVKDSTSWQDTVKTNDSRFLSPRAGAVVSGGSRVSYAVRGSYGKSFRLPTINALFWKGDTRSSGNPGLKPEKSEHSEAGLEMNIDGGIIGLAGGMTYFHSHITGQVVWQPNFQGVWRPINLAASQISGHEDFIELSLFSGGFRLKYQNTVTTALNKVPGPNSYNKRLVFYPHYITTVRAELNIWRISGAYSVRFVDKAFINEANTRYYDRYRLDDIRFSASFEIRESWLLSTYWQINNIRDIDYVLMTHYPMPGREWQAGLKIKFSPEKAKRGK